MLLKPITINALLRLASCAAKTSLGQVSPPDPTAYFDRADSEASFAEIAEIDAFNATVCLVWREQALDGERALQAEINQATSDYIVRLQKQRKAANALPKITLVNDCTVPVAVGSVLNDAQRMHADAGTESGVGPASATVDSTCAAELDIAKRNYAEVCVPNAIQLNALQEQ